MPRRLCRAISAAVLAWTCFLSIHCRSQDARWGGKFETVDGVVVVKNPAQPIDPHSTLQLREELTIGRDDAGEEYLFSDIGSFDVSDEGLIYVVNRLDADIRVFDGSGRFLRTIGRKGQGPGEMGMPVFIRIGEGGEVFVFDYLVGRGLFFGPDGVFRRQQPGLRRVLPIGRDSQGRIIGSEILAPPPLGGKIIRAYDADLAPRFEIARENQGSRNVFDIGRPSCYCVLNPDDAVVWGDSKEYVLHVLDPEGREVRRIMKPFDPVPISSEDRASIEERYADAVMSGYRIEFRSHRPAFGGLFADDAGRILVRTYEHPDFDRATTFYDVFDPDGRYTARVPIRVNIDGNSVWKAGKLYTWETDPGGFPVIKRFQVLWGEEKD